jgi:hypothetical protein
MVRAGASRCHFCKQLLVVLVAAFGAGPAAADIYTSRNPAGKIIVSNVAPVSKSTQVTVLRSPSSQTAAVRSMPVSVARRAHSAAARPGNGDASGSDTLHSDVVGALANVMGMSHLISSTRDFCMATLPASGKRYSGAAVAWQQRNAVVVAKKNRILSMSDRNLIASALNGDMVRMTEDMMRPVKGAGTAEKIKWCDTTIDAVDRGVLDLAGRASIAPLMNYTLR